MMIKGLQRRIEKLEAERNAPNKILIVDCDINGAVDTAGGRLVAEYKQRQPAGLVVKVTNYGKGTDA
jgi:hypothetical protein